MSADELAGWVRDEQRTLWTELGRAIDHAANRTWSIDAANLARRIVQAARLVGPTGYKDVPWPLLAGGVYAAVLNAGAVAVELPDEAEWERLDELMGRNGSWVTRSSARTRYARTVERIETARERNWINGGDE